MSRLKLLVLAMVWPMLLAGVNNVYSQASGAGSMFGSVVDESGQRVPGADIVITNENTGEVRSGVSNEVGDYTFQGLQAGPYTVRAQLSGFKPFEIKKNMVLANNRLSVQLLRLEVGTLSETVRRFESYRMMSPRYTVFALFTHWESRTVFDRIRLSVAFA